MSAWLVLALLLAAAAYCIHIIRREWRAGRRAVAASGLVALVTVYGALGWLTYVTAKTLSDAITAHYGPDAGRSRPR